MSDKIEIRGSSADGRSDVRASVSLEFGSKSPVTRWRGVTVASYPCAEVTLDPATMPLTLDEECLQVCEQAKVMLDEGRTRVIKQIVNRYETYRRPARMVDAVDVHEQDEDFDRRLHAMLDRLGITDHGF